MSDYYGKAFTYMAIVGAGVSVALQQVVNARLRLELASPWWAGFISYLVGMLVMLAAIVASGEPPLSSAALARVSWWSWTGGVFGAVFIGTAILTVPRLGTAAVLALIVLGQMLGSLVFDQVGLLGLAQQSMTPVRLTGALLLLLGVVLVRG